MASYALGRQRTTLCIFYEKGWCKSGDDCRFTHGTSDKRKLLGDGVEGALGKPATIREPCKFFAKGTCSRGNMCPFSHSSYSADEAHRRETLADNRPSKRPAPAALASQRCQPVGVVTVAEQPPPIRRGMLMVTKQDLLPLDGGDTDTEDSDLEDEPWEIPGSNEGSAYFFGAPGRFDAESGGGGGGDGGVSSATSGKGHGSWRDIVQGSSETCEDPTVANDGKPLLVVDATVRALVSSAAADAGVDVEVKPPRDEARAARAAAAFLALNSALSSPRAGKRKVCAFFARGCCRFGEHCRNSHELDQPETVEVTKEVDGQGHQEEEVAVVEEEAEGAEEERDLGKDAVAKDAALDEAEKAQSQVADCGVCLERISDRFGILVGCRHSYCLKCIREWRGKSQKRNCPECGVPSHFVVPSHTLVTDPVRKELLVSRYKESLSTIPCQHFEFGVSECPFGSSCFYAHLKKDGSLDLPATPRIRWSAAGDSEAMREVHLSSFFDPRL